MTDPERYQREFDELMRDTAARAERVKHLQGIERIEQLFAAAERAGIGQAMAWKIIERDPTDAKAGLMDLIEEVWRRMTTDQRKEQIRHRIDSKAKAIADGQGTWGENIVQEMRIAVPFELTEEEERYIWEYAQWRKDHPISN